MGNREEGVAITFPLYHKSRPRESIKIISETLQKNNVDWLRYEKPRWIFDSMRFKEVFEGVKTYDWLVGDLLLEMDHENDKETIFEREEDRTYCRFVITPEIVMEQTPKKIFLSHKGVDKPLVRNYKIVLESIGFDIWLDTDAMSAGAEFERSLLAGFHDSCAAIFFITPNYVDENYLATEINYAIAEKRKKGDRFSIITLVLKDNEGNKGEVPPLLNQYVWKEPDSELEAITEIIKALPMRIGKPDWK